jgi:DNA-binding response OmpR family regulator
MITSKSLKILIIDDSATECLFMQKALADVGYQCLVANDGYEGLKIVLREKPDCLILDIVLPGISGFEVCRQIRSQSLTRDLPIIIVSTKNSPSDKFWAKKQGANYYLPKPFKGPQLIQAITEVLAEYSSPPPNTTQQRATGHGPAQSKARTNSSPLPPIQNTTTASTASRNTGHQPVPIAKLIPRRVEINGVPRNGNQDPALLADRVAQHLYSLVDGHINVEMLVARAQLRRNEFMQAFRFLLIERYIQLYDPDGRPIDNSTLMI